jgi:hypothetical protein
LPGCNDWIALMRHFYKPLPAVLMLLVAGCDQNVAKDEKKDAQATGPGVTLEADDIDGLGLAITPAASASYIPGVSGFGVVVSMDTVGQTDADLLTAQAAAAQSAAAARRARELSTGDEAAVSLEQLDLALSKAAADEAALGLARRKAQSSFGLAAPWRDPATRTRVMGELSLGRSIVVRATFPLGALGSGVPAGITVVPLGGPDQSWTSHTIWAAPADANVPGRSFYLLLSGSDLAQGERVTVSAPTGSVKAGILLPASALVLSESQSWAYIEIKPHTFLREPVDMSRPLPGGYFQTGTGVRVGQGIVTAGAGLLLARETNPSTEPAD